MSESSSDSQPESDFSKVLKSLSLKDFLNVGSMPCASKSIFAGLVCGIPVGFIRFLISKRWRSAGNWGIMTWAFTGSMSYQYCIYQRRIVLQEFEKMGQFKV